MGADFINNLYEDYVNGVLIRDLKKKYPVDSSLFFRLCLEHHMDDIRLSFDGDITDKHIKTISKEIKGRREVSKILNKMTLNGHRPTEEEAALFIASNAGSVSDASLCIPLGCPLTTIKRFMRISRISNDFAQHRKNVSGLTLAQEEVLLDLKRGLRKKEIAGLKSVTPGCVSGYLKRIRRIIGQDGFDEAVREGCVARILNEMVEKSDRSSDDIKKIIDESVNVKLNKDIAAEIGCPIRCVNEYFRLTGIVNEMNMITMEFDQRRDIIVKRVKQLHEEGVPLYSGYIKRNYRKEIYNRADMFGGYRNLIEAAGLNYDEIKLWTVNRKYHRGYWSRDRVVERGMAMNAEDLTPKRLCEMGESGLYNAIKKYYGSVKEFADHLGVEYKGRYRTNAGQKRKRKGRDNDGGQDAQHEQ